MTEIRKLCLRKNRKNKSEKFLKHCHLAGGGAEQQPRGRPSADARAETESHGLATARLGSWAQTVISSSLELSSWLSSKPKLLKSEAVIVRS